MHALSASTGHPAAPGHARAAASPVAAALACDRSTDPRSTDPRHMRRAAASEARRALSSADRSSSRLRAGSALVNKGKSVDPVAQRHAKLRENRALRMTAARLSQSFDHKLANRLSGCRQRRWGDTVTLRRDLQTGHAGYHGLQTCASVWACPSCSARISAARRSELDTLLAWGRAEKLSPVLLTLTFAHSRGDALAPMLEALKLALRRLRQRREWRALGLVGSVSATEVTHGVNSWHPHLHIVCLHPGSEAQAVAAFAALLPVWLTCLRAYGLTGNAHALQIQGAASAGDYIGKWGAAEEMTLSGVKAGRSGSRTPWQLLADADAGDGLAAVLWTEYAQAFKGRRQLVFSPGLKARAGLVEASDADAAAEVPGDEPGFEALRVWLKPQDGRPHPWKDARRRSVAMIVAAETGACLDAAEHGPADCQQWQRERFGPVLEPS